jgi:hypothetical protein
MINKMRKDSLARKSGKTANNSSTPKVAVKDNSNVTLYKESEANSLTSLPGNTSPDTKNAVVELLKVYKKTAAGDGFPANDLAYAYQYFVVNNYNVYHNIVPMPTDLDPDLRKAADMFDRIYILETKKSKRVTTYQEKLIYKQFKEGLSEDPKIQKMTDAEKQNSAEILATMQGLIFVMYENALKNKDDKEIDEARKMAKEAMEKLFETSVDKIHISNFGFSIY